MNTTTRVLTFLAFLIYGTAMCVPSLYPRLFPHSHAPDWLRYTTAGVLAVPLVALAGLIALGIGRRLVRCFRTRRTVDTPAIGGGQR